MSCGFWFLNVVYCLAHFSIWDDFFRTVRNGRKREGTTVTNEQLEQMRTNTHFNARSPHINKWFVRDPFFLLDSAFSGGGGEVLCVYHWASVYINKLKVHVALLIVCRLTDNIIQLIFSIIRCNSFVIFKSSASLLSFAAVDVCRGLLQYIPTEPPRIRIFDMLHLMV